MIELLTSKLFCNDELKVVHIANFEVDLCSSSVEYCSISNVNSLYQCSCKQCCAIAVYAMCYSLLSIHVDTGLQELYLPSLVMGIHCTMWWVWKDIKAVDLSESESISGAEVNLTICALSNGVLCCNLAESKSVLKMCISKHCHEVTGFLSWIGTYCISCVVQQRSRVKDLSFLVGYDDS